MSRKVQIVVRPLISDRDLILDRDGVRGKGDGPGSLDAGQEKTKALRDKLTALKTKNTAAKQKIEKAKTNNEFLRAHVEQINDKVAMQVAQVKALKVKIKAVTRDTERILKEIDLEDDKNI